METQLSNDELTQVNGGTNWDRAVDALVLVGSFALPEVAIPVGATFYALEFSASIDSPVPDQGDVTDPMTGQYMGSDSEHQNSEEGRRT